VPSPIGHALGGLAAGWLVAAPEPTRRGRVIQAAILAGVAVAPDLDLLVGRHSGETHSLGAALIAGAVAAWMRWPVARARWQIFFAVCVAWASHPLLDVFGQDTSAPYGVMVFWPFSHAYVYTNLGWFLPIYRRWWLPGFVAHNLTAAFWELVILAPITAVVWWIGRRARAGRPTR
jgi:LexA-binding, inner membrane-associated putative hydrolase